ncbi:MAG: A/G-specific adenine glycosylase [Ekhidna sp.]|nr:A/G-specific adenine glycosylase [Ekhidna sp.]
MDLMHFTKKLISWYTERKRELPWRKIKDPYPIWLSEIILQQTRVEQGLPYWEQFIKEFPSIHDLANATEDKVLRLWQGLGYYSRARNLLFAAKYISKELEGKFPKTYKEILALKGVGPYTAAAIASICFNEATPVVDGNVFRFSSRYFGIKKDISASKTRNIFEKYLQKVIDRNQPGVFNQAMMEFGATICSPQPKCVECIFRESCYAFSKSMQKELPVKTKKVKVSTRHLNYVAFSSDNHFLLKQRGPKDIWQGLYDFYLVEGELSEGELMHNLTLELELKGHLNINEKTEETEHILSHQKIMARFFEIELSEMKYHSIIQKTNLMSFSIEELLNLPKPKLIVNYLEKVGIK